MDQTPDTPWTVIDWHGLYTEKWGETIVPESYRHPARFQPALIRRIYLFAEQERMLRPGDHIVDPFGGVALGAREAIVRGMHWEGMEIERHFHDVGQGCDCTGISKEDYVRFYGRWERARYLDGRHWCPACMAALKTPARPKQTAGTPAQKARRSRMKALAKETKRAVSVAQPLPLPGSPAGTDSEPVQVDLFGLLRKPSLSYERNAGAIPFSQPHRYLGNIGIWQGFGPGTARLHLGDSRNLVAVLLGERAAIVSSPPYERSVHDGNGIDPTKLTGNTTGQRSSAYAEGYGNDPGQLGRLTGTQNGFEVSLSSPPYARSMAQHATANDAERRRQRMAEAGLDLSVASNVGGGNSVYTQPQAYSASPENLGNQPASDEGFSASLSSPPYGGMSDKHDRTGHEREVRRLERINPDRVGHFTTIFKNDGAYGDDAANLNNQQASEVGFDMAVSSPPYAGTRIDGAGDEGASGLRMADGSYPRGKDGWEARKAMGGRYGDTSGQLAGMSDDGYDAALSSPPYAQARINETGGNDPANMRRSHHTGTYGATEGQLVGMAASEYDAAVSSPPYADSSIAPISVQGYDAGGLKMNEGQTYGATEGQLGAMTSGDFDGAITSPPYETSRVDTEFQRRAADPTVDLSMPEETKGYGGSNGRERTEQARQDFWLSARQIVDQTYALLRPGGTAFWVVQDYVRDHQVVPFCDQWRRLCEAAGFVTTHMIRVWRVEDHGTQYDIEGRPVKKEVHRYSFFRRLHARNYPHLAINYEVVWVMQKGEGSTG